MNSNQKNSDRNTLIGAVSSLVGYGIDRLLENARRYKKDVEEELSYLVGCMVLDGNLPTSGHSIDINPYIPAFDPRKGTIPCTRPVESELSAEPSCIYEEDRVQLVRDDLQWEEICSGTYQWMPEWYDSSYSRKERLEQRTPRTCLGRCDHSKDCMGLVLLMKQVIMTQNLTIARLDEAVKRFIPEYDELHLPWEGDIYDEGTWLLELYKSDPAYLDFLDLCPEGYDPEDEDWYRNKLIWLQEGTDVDTIEVVGGEDDFDAGQYLCRNESVGIDAVQTVRILHDAISALSYQKSMAIQGREDLEMRIQKLEMDNTILVGQLMEAEITPDSDLSGSVNYRQMASAVKEYRAFKEIISRRMWIFEKAEEKAAVQTQA